MNERGRQADFSALDFSRVAVIGCPGSGKTTFAKSMGAIMSRQVWHLDKVLWNPNWEMLPYDKRKAIHDGLISSGEWIIDGMWRSHLADRFGRATLIIFLDYKRRVSYFRALKRRIKYRGKQRDDIADGCLEKLDKDFTEYIWNFRKNVRPTILRLIAEYPQTAVITLPNPKSADKFLYGLSRYVANKTE